MTDDELLAEVQRRLDEGRFGFHGLMCTDQANFRDNWHALAAVVYDARNRYPAEFGTRLVHDKLLELADRAGLQTRPYRVNTTHYGREYTEENQPS